MARAVFHGKKGELRQRYREGMEDQLGALGLVVNAWCCGTPATCNKPWSSARRRRSPEPGDVARLSPLLHEHINMLGRYDFTLPERVAAGELRPLRDLANWQEQLVEFP